MEYQLPDLGETVVISYKPIVKKKYRQPPDIVKKQRMARRKKLSQLKSKSKLWRQRNKSALQRRMNMRHFPLGPVKPKKPT